jgi:hypothetical protein
MLMMSADDNGNNADDNVKVVMIMYANNADDVC